MDLKSAHDLALEILNALAPACTRIAIAGSLRRGKADVRDLEIIAQPDLTRKPRPQFGNIEFPKTLLEAALDELVRSGRLSPIKGGDRYKQFAVADNRADSIKLDLFIVRESAQWGVIYAIRTGPAAFSQWLVTKREQGGALPSHLRVNEGAVWDGAQMIETPEEEDFFRVLGFDWLEPARREPRWGALRDEPAADVSADIAAAMKNFPKRLVIPSKEKGA